jgi:hypothetical protein
VTGQRTRVEVWHALAVAEEPNKLPCPGSGFRCLAGSVRYREAQARGRGVDSGTRLESVLVVLFGRTGLGCGKRLREDPHGDRLTKIARARTNVEGLNYEREIGI